MPDWPVPQAPSPVLIVSTLEDALVELVEVVALLIELQQLVLKLGKLLLPTCCVQLQVVRLP